LALCWLLPVVNAWLWIDARRVRCWRTRIIEICHAGQLDVETFCSTINHLKHLPQSTLSGMLDLLPSDRNATPAVEDGMSDKKQLARPAERTYRISLIVSGIGCLIVMMGLLINSWLLLMGLTICFVSAKLSQWITVGMRP
ncbi:MAG: hypothetical protein ABI557_19405, partial [Aureliella sp.]